MNKQANLSLLNRPARLFGIGERLGEMIARDECLYKQLFQALYKQPTHGLQRLWR